MNTHSGFREMDTLSLSQFLSRYGQLLRRLYASADLRDPHPLLFDQIAGVDFGNGLVVLLGSTRFARPTCDAADSNAFVTSACLDLVDITRETVRGRVVVSDMRLGLAAAVYRPDVIATHLEGFTRDHATVFKAVQHTRALRSLLTPAAGERGLTVRYIECVTVTDRTRFDEDGTLLVRALLALSTTDFTHAMIIPDGASERAMVEALGFRKASGKTSCWFYTDSTYTALPTTPASTPTPSAVESGDHVASEHHTRAFA